MTDRFPGQTAHWSSEWLSRRESKKTKKETKETLRERTSTMSIQSIKKNQKWLAPAAILLTLSAVFVARTAFAGIQVNTINPLAIVADKGRQVTVAGPLAATAGDRVELRVTVTQRFTGALAEGRAFLTGTGALQQWEVETAAEGGATFEAG